MKQGFLIPVYRHGQTVSPLVKKLSVFGLPIIIVDDGNDNATKTILLDIADSTPLVILVSLKKNSGKGKACILGLEKARELGIEQILQLDADGQHDIDKAEFFLNEAVKNPHKVICGYPQFDESAPKSRVRGRKISVFWGAVTTLSMQLKDTHCGFRVYPVKETLRITKNPFLDKRMGFDSEILVRLYWKRIFPLFYPVNVNYPKDGFSNFRMVRDNFRISWTFCRLSIGMLLRLPYLIIINHRRRVQENRKVS